VAALVRVWRRFCIAGLQTFTLFHYDTTQGIVTVLLFLLPLAGSISDVIDYNRAGLTLQPVERACCCCLSFDMTGYCGLFARCGCARCGGIMDDILFLRRIFFFVASFSEKWSVAATFSPYWPSQISFHPTAAALALLQPPWYQRASDDGPIGIPSGRAARSRDGKVDGCVQAMGACELESWIKLNDDGRIERTRTAIHFRITFLCPRSDRSHSLQHTAKITGTTYEFSCVSRFELQKDDQIANEQVVELGSHYSTRISR